MSKLRAYFRVLKRWTKQKLGIEKYNHPPTLKQISYNTSIVKSYYKKEKEKLSSLELYKDKVVYINKRGINNILKTK